jgi:exodeoxyribonuclease V alpha subunit
MKIGRIGSISDDGTTIVYDADSEEMLEVRIPKVPEGTELTKDGFGDWHVEGLEFLPPETANRLKQSETFYYATRSFLPYKDYLYVCNQMPTNCYTQFEKNPYFLTDLQRENTESPICSMPQIDRCIVLNTFEKRLLEMKYAISFVLEKNENKGNTWMTYGELNKRVKALLKATRHPLLKGEVAQYLSYYQNEFYVEETYPYAESKVSLFSTFFRENMIYRAVVRAVGIPTPFPRHNPIPSEDFSTEQNRAVKNLILEGGHLSILTGGPGTGKTTILKKMVDDLSAGYPDAKMYLLSPTGKAAKRIKEVFGCREIEISTVHKFLGYGRQLSAKERAKINTADLVVVDESSMLDLDIFERLLSMLNLERTKLILVGDVDQLPSIGAGNIFSDLIALGVHTERLTQNYRSQGSIISNAHKINEGCVFLTTDESFQMMEPASCLSDYMAAMEAESDIVITPYRVEKKKGSAVAVNQLIQKRIFAKSPSFYTSAFRIGDRVIMVHTNYKQGYFNGETGVILAYLPSGDYLVGFGDRELTIKNPEDMELGYAITVHKSQGSEYEVADICIPEYSDFITRRMFYTAVTRAKGKVRIWATKETIRKIILNNPDVSRKTFLSSFPKIA